MTALPVPVGQNKTGTRRTRKNLLKLFKEDNTMKTGLRRLLAIFATVAFGAVMVPMASAGCANPLQDGGAHVSPQSWEGQVDFGTTLLLLASDHDDNASMVGMWHVVFTAKGNVGPGLPPDGVPVDNALSQWHSDGTEVTTSSRNPVTGSLCLGVWQKIGHRRFRLNHFGISWDPTTDPNNPQGLANIRESVALSGDGKTFVGTFTIQQFDQSGNLLVEIKGLLSGTRIDMNTTVGQLL
jgi:hypothetical protein